ncbi:hypothetical protein NIES4102_41190 (plasmid) [Chondrocystis sp. NIES-4102]|nr:hypothetical protein NIES4102_41190 [Chondrocystis sp. NIES-4102]
MLYVKKFKLVFLILFICCLYLPRKATAQQKLIKLFPDWNKISLDDLSKFNQDGEINSEYDQIADYKVSREWVKGDSPEDVLKLGDLTNSLQPQNFTLEQISVLTKSQIIQSTDIPLSEFSLASKQNIESLIKAVPDLGSLSAKQVPPIAKLLEENNFDIENIALKTLISRNKKIANLELDSINLQKYTVGSIPNLELAQLKDFAEYKDSLISEIPGLTQVPLGSYPNPLTPVGNSFARIDFIWGSAESDRNRTISGSYPEGFNVLCKSNCEYFELDDLENIGVTVQSQSEGKQWIAGREHWVSGGTGCLSGGREPTGIHPFGELFKSVLWRTDETTDTGEIVMFFNFNVMCGSSAYFIGPIPFPMGNVGINDVIFVGTGI